MKVITDMPMQLALKGAVFILKTWQLIHLTLKSGDLYWLILVTVPKTVIYFSLRILSSSRLLKNIIELV